MRRGDPSPWGEIQDVTRWTDGIEFVSTASHGGFWLSDRRVVEMFKRLKKVLEPFTQDYHWWEEDCDAEHVVSAFKEIFFDANGTPRREP